MSYFYEIAKNLPASAVRFYRFPYKGERDSSRLNLFIHAMIGDIRLMATAISDVEGMETYDNIGGLFMTEVDATKLLS